jgi:hypothetical protein
MMWGVLFSWITGGGLSGIAGKLEKAYEAKLAAQTDQEKLKADMDIEQLKARQSVLVAEQGSWLTSWIRPGIAAPFVIFLWKIIVWDKVLALGTTDDLSPQIWQVFMVVVGAYFLTRPFEKRG